MEEKGLRFQSEFQLARWEAGENAAPSRNTPSESGLSLPSTTESARKLTPSLNADAGGIDAGFLREVATVGEKEQWLIHHDEVRVLPGEVLGEGGFGRVLGGSYQGVAVAIKVP